MDLRQIVLMEENLREASALGDLDAVKELIKLGVNVNAGNAVNGWTALHWACKRNFIDVATLLIQNGADKKVRSANGETPISVTKNPKIMQLLGVTTNAINDFCPEEPSAGFTPNYIKNAPLNFKFDSNQFDVRKHKFLESSNDSKYDLVLKLRIAESTDPDFIEVDVDSRSLTFQSLISLCSKELEINEKQILKLRKLPNTKLRNDRDVQRLENFQEIEVVATLDEEKSAALNCYQSISKKDQTVLY